MAETFKGLITDEGINQARFVDDQNEPSSGNSGWYITPYKFSISEDKGSFDKSRDLSSRKDTWVENYFTKVEKFMNNKLLLTVTILGDASDVQRRIGELYITAKTKEPSGDELGEEYLYCLVQTIEDDLIFKPGVTLEFQLFIALNNDGVSDTYTIDYELKQDLSDYQLLSEKSQPDGYCPLDSSAKVPRKHVLELNCHPASCISGKVDTETGYPNILTYTNQTVKFSVGDSNPSLEVIFPDGEYKEFTHINNFSTSSLSSGTYNLFINKSGNIVALKNNCYSSRKTPGRAITEVYYTTETGYTDAAWTRPNLYNSNGVMGGSSPAAEASGERSAAFEAWRAFDDSDSTYWYNSPGSTSSSLTAWITYYTPEPVKLQSVVISSNNSYYVVKSGSIQASNDNSNWTTIAYINNPSAAINYSISIASNDYYKYFRFFATSLKPNVGDFAYYNWTVKNIAMSGMVRQSYTYQQKHVRVISGNLENGDIWLDTSTKPYNMYQYNNGVLEPVDYVRLPQQIIVDSNHNVTGTKIVRAYNANGWDEELSAPDLERPTTLTSGITFTAPYSGWVLNYSSAQSYYLERGFTYTPNSSGYTFYPIKGV